MEHYLDVHVQHLKKLRKLIYFARGIFFNALNPHLSLLF